MNRKHLAAATAALVSGAMVAAGVTTAPATAAVADKPTTIDKLLLSPLSVAASDDGTVYYSQNFMGTLLSRSPGKKPVVHYQSKGDEVGAISEHHGSVRFATTGKKQLLWGIGGSGKAVKLADLGAHEAQKNPDAKQAYGFESISPGCAGQLPTGEGAPPAQYTGIVESHPYGTDIDRSTTYVADAAANAVLKVNGRGKVSTVAVLPGVPVEVTQAIADSVGWPNCTLGLTYVLEAVPTDVEKGPDGKLYVSTLTGGPEDGSTGAVAKVYKVNPKTGKAKVFADHLVSATGVTVADNGDVYVAQLFAGNVLRFKKGKSTGKPFFEAPFTAAVDWNDGLYATTHAMIGLLEEGQAPGGKVVWVG